MINNIFIYWISGKSDSEFKVNLREWLPVDLMGIKHNPPAAQLTTPTFLTFI